MYFPASKAYRTSAQNPSDSRQLLAGEESCIVRLMSGELKSENLLFEIR